MHCRVCGTGNDETARVCVACKAALFAATQRVLPPEAAPSNAGSSSTPGAVEGPRLAAVPGAPRPHVPTSTNLPPSAITEGAFQSRGTSDGDDEVRFAPGQLILGTYRIERQVGRGGMGSVFLARDDVSGQRVAVKVLPGALAKERGIRDRFVQEARALAALDHPGIVPLITFAQESDDRFLVMKFVDGRSLDARLRQDKVLPPDEALRIVREVCLALDYAHGKGVVHRDIKPANVLLDENGRVVVVDFGIARKLEGEKRLTQTGMLMGTPQYMSPEQIEGHVVDGRADLYACGLMLFEMLAGRPPFDAERTFDILKAHVEKPVPDLRTIRARVDANAVTVPDHVVALVELLLQKDPSARPSNGAAVVALLDEQGRAVPQRLASSVPALAPERRRDTAETSSVPVLSSPRDDEPIVVPGGNPGLRLLAALAVVGVAGAGVGYAVIGMRPARPAVVDAGAADAFQLAGLLARAQVAREKGDLEGARISTATVLQLDPDNVDALLLQVELFIDAARLDDARAALVRLPAELDADNTRKREVVRGHLEAAELRAKQPPEAPRPRPKPATTTATTTTTRPRPTQLPEAQQAAITRTTNDRLQACFVEHELSVDPDSRGDVILTARVAADGSVHDASIKKSSFVNANFHRCITDTARAWRFPAFDGDDDVIVRTFHFYAQR